MGTRRARTLRGAMGAEEPEGLDAVVGLDGVPVEGEVPAAVAVEVDATRSSACGLGGAGGGADSRSAALGRRPRAARKPEVMKSRCCCAAWRLLRMSSCSSASS